MGLVWHHSLRRAIFRRGFLVAVRRARLAQVLVPSIRDIELDGSDYSDSATVRSSM